MSFTPVPSPNFYGMFCYRSFLNRPPGRPTTERPGALQDQGAQGAQGPGSVIEMNISWKLNLIFNEIQLSDIQLSQQKLDFHSNLIRNSDFSSWISSRWLDILWQTTSIFCWWHKIIASTQSRLANQESVEQAAVAASTANEGYKFIGPRRAAARIKTWSGWSGSGNQKPQPPYTTMATLPWFLLGKMTRIKMMNGWNVDFSIVFIFACKSSVDLWRYVGFTMGFILQSVGDCHNPLWEIHGNHLERIGFCSSRCV